MNDRKLTNADLFYAYFRGWTCGASHRALDPKLSEHTDEQLRDAYHDGWAAGRVASKDAGRHAEKLYGYSPSILRVQDADAEPLADQQSGDQI